MVKTVPRGRSYTPIAVTLAVAVISLLALLFVNPGPLKRLVVKSPEVVPSADTTAAAKAAGATVTPTDPKLAIEPTPPGPKPVQPAAPN
jgi:hypothetical protein